MRRLSPNARDGGAIAAVVVAVIIELAYRGWPSLAGVCLFLALGFALAYRPGQ